MATTSEAGLNLRVLGENGIRKAEIGKLIQNILKGFCFQANFLEYEQPATNFSSFVCSRRRPLVAELLKHQ